MDERALTIRQPWADLIMAGVKDAENRTWPVPSTLPQWYRCEQSGHARRSPSMVARTGALDCDTEDGPFPFRLWVHAGQQYDLRAGNRAIIDWATRVSDETHRRGSGPLLSPIKEIERFQDPDRRGVLLGSVTVTGCHHADDCHTTCAIHGDVGCGPSGRYCSRWAEPDVFHWTLTDPDPLPVPVPLRGRQGLWTVPDDVLVRADQLASGAYI